jgi:hypothetical protein
MMPSQAPTPRLQFRKVGMSGSGRTRLLPQESGVKANGAMEQAGLDEGPKDEELPAVLDRRSGRVAT